MAVAAGSAPVVLFLSNGYGEDVVGAALAARLQRRVEPGAARVVALPMVGLGSPYESAGIPVLSPRQHLPSEGFSYLSRSLLWQDLRAGLISLTLRQAAKLSRIRNQVALVVAVGDAIVLAMAMLFARRPLAFVSVADSAYLTDGRTVFTPPVRAVLRRARRLYVHDAFTREVLARYGVDARFPGNPMMDTFEVDPAGDRAAFPTVGLLPGSRAPEANLPLLLEAVGEVRKTFPGAAFDMAWPPGRPLPQGLEARHGVTCRPFGTVLARAHVAIGLAGTANEQTVGLGIPLVTFVGRGPQGSPAFVYRQKKLLGEAMWVATGPADAGRSVCRILSDPALHRRMAAEGRRRMGERGGADRIADDLWSVLRELLPSAGAREAARPGAGRVAPLS